MLPRLTVDHAHRLVQDGTATGGMLKIGTAIEAVKGWRTQRRGDGRARADGPPVIDQQADRGLSPSRADARSGTGKDSPLRFALGGRVHPGESTTTQRGPPLVETMQSEVGEESRARLAPHALDEVARPRAMQLDALGDDGEFFQHQRGHDGGDGMVDLALGAHALLLLTDVAGVRSAEGELCTIRLKCTAWCRTVWRRGGMIPRIGTAKALFAAR